MNMNIQNSTWTKRQKNHHLIYIEKPSMKDYLLTFSIFVGCTVIGLVFQKLHFTDINIVTVYILGVLVTSIVTDGYLCGLVGSFLSVVLFCFFLTEPRMSFQTYAVGYPVTFLIMLISSVQTGKGMLAISELQLEGKKRMPVEAFLNGYEIEEGTYFKKG